MDITTVIRTKQSSLLFKFLTIVLFRTKNEQRAKKSKYEYGKDNKGYYLRVIGVLHYYIGLTLELEEFKPTASDIRKGRVPKGL